jgi:hypothetical protein
MANPPETTLLIETYYMLLTVYLQMITVICEKHVKRCENIVVLTTDFFKTERCKIN